MNPFMAFCLFVAARIYAHAFKKRPNDQHARSNLEFLLRAMAAGRKKNPLTESFLVQLMVDLEGCGLDIGFDLHSKLVFPNKSMVSLHAYFEDSSFDMNLGWNIPRKQRVPTSASQPFKNPAKLPRAA
jgi:hypothetical protein